MKNAALFMVWFTTLFLVALTILAFFNVGFSWIFFLTLTGQILVVVMVYKVLRDQFTTDKTFEKFFYEDSAIERSQH